MSNLQILRPECVVFWKFLSILSSNCTFQCWFLPFNRFTDSHTYLASSTASGTNWHGHSRVVRRCVNERCSTSCSWTNRYPVVDCLRWRYWSWVDRISQLGTWWQQIADHALWGEDSVWSQCQLPVWVTRSELCFSCYHFSHGNDLFKVSNSCFAVASDVK